MSDIPEDDRKEVVAAIAREIEEDIDRDFIRFSNANLQAIVNENERLLEQDLERMSWAQQTQQNIDERNQRYGQSFRNGWIGQRNYVEAVAPGVDLDKESIQLRSEASYYVEPVIRNTIDHFGHNYVSDWYAQGSRWFVNVQNNEYTVGTRSGYSIYPANRAPFRMPWEVENSRAQYSYLGTSKPSRRELAFAYVETLYELDGKGPNKNCVLFTEHGRLRFSVLREGSETFTVVDKLPSDAFVGEWCVELVAVIQHLEPEIYYPAFYGPEQFEDHSILRQLNSRTESWPNAEYKLPFTTIPNIDASFDGGLDPYTLKPRQRSIAIEQQDLAVRIQDSLRDLVGRPTTPMTVSIIEARTREVLRAWRRPDISVTATVDEGDRSKFNLSFSMPNNVVRFRVDD